MMKNLLLVLVLLAGVAHAQEHILAYDSDVYVQADGSMDIEEHITVRAEGQQIRRGIYRDFPVRYKDRAGNRVVVDFDVREVLRNGQPEPWFTELLINGVRLNTGDDSLLPVPADQAYTLRFRTHRQLGFFDDHDELYWNAIGTGWVFPIASATVTVHLPQAVPMQAMQLEGYTGVQGATGQDFHAAVLAPGVAQWQLTRPLDAYEGLTIVLGFPKGVVTEPTWQQRRLWLLQDNLGVLIALLTALFVVLFLAVNWWRVGRDPASGVIMPRYEPMLGLSPAAMRFISRMRHDSRCFTADLVGLGVAGYLQINQADTLVGKQWSLARTQPTKAVALPPSQQAVLTGLFASQNVLELKQSNHYTLGGVQTAQRKSLAQAFGRGKLFSTHYGYSATAFLLSFLGIMAAAFTSAAMGGAGLLVVVAIAFVLFALCFVFAWLMVAPTKEGRKVMDQIAGFKQYLSVAEQQDLASLTGPGQPPQLDAARFQQLLPYAIALDVEDAWSKKFIQAVGTVVAADTARQGFYWYRGGSITSLSSFTSAIGTSLNRHVASSSRSPGSSSGSGGGGFSGGGGGGGGGGGR